ncbi:MAG: CehA/McbA family metallohydrolase [Kiritimatiellae bacterium]|nr:CehA/McbA family metallohydrolase [Kiritimatiellia bacterium]
MNAYWEAGAARKQAEEIRALFAGQLNADVVDGFARMLRAGDAVRGGARQAGFHENHRPEEWLLPLAARAGMTWQTAALPDWPRERVAFVLSLGFGNGSPLSQPSGQWDIFVNGHAAVSVRVVNHSQCWRSGEAALAFAANRIETAPPFMGLTLSSTIRDEAFAAFGPALLVVPTRWLTPGEPAEIRAEPRAATASTRWLQLDRASNILPQANVYPLLALLRPEARRRIGAYTVYFGDTHTHSGETDDGGEGCGLGTRAENYAYARGPGALDFYALTDHERQIRDPARYFALADAHNEDGRFVCLPAFEHTSPFYGHRNVYFRSAGGLVVEPTRAAPAAEAGAMHPVTPPELWAALAETGVPFITVPHHPSAASHPCTWDYFDPRFDRLVEVYSVWGSSEYYGDFPRGVSDRYRNLDVRDAVRRGYRFGLIASADGHDGHPGNAHGPGLKHPHQYHFCGSGRAAVLAETLTRDAVFDALHARRCYATTGTPIALDVTLNGMLMGEEADRLPNGTRPVLRLHCEGTNGLDHVRIVKNAQVVATVPCHGEWAAEYEWADPTFDADRANSYYVRVVQIDRESAWSSPIWVG